MELRVEAMPGGLGGSVVRLAGRLDGPGAKRFRQSVGELCGVRPLPLAVDFEEVTAVLAVGAEALLWLAERQRAVGAGLVFVQARPTSQPLLGAVGLTTLVPTVPTLADARAWLAAHARQDERPTDAGAKALTNG